MTQPGSLPRGDACWVRTPYLHRLAPYWLGITNQHAQPAGFFHIQVSATSPTGSVAFTRVFTGGG